MGSSHDTLCHCRHQDAFSVQEPSWARTVIRLWSKLGIYGKTEKRRKSEEEGEDKEEEEDGAMDALVASSSDYPCGCAVGGLFPMAGTPHALLLRLRFQCKNLGGTQCHRKRKQNKA